MAESSRAGLTAGGTGILLRPGVTADLDRVRDLLQICKLPLHGVDAEFGERYVVAEHDGLLVGVQAVEMIGPYGMIRSAAVAPSLRGSGMGSAMTRDRIEWSKKRGIPTLFLFTETAKPFFEKLGFREIARGDAPLEVQESDEAKSVCHSTATLMQLDL
jgi:N-acetylglutamate synthase-like GNAT family acetyltransferase